eukprot:3562912-Amphidinium_carterae.1
MRSLSLASLCLSLRTADISARCPLLTLLAILALSLTRNTRQDEYNMSRWTKPHMAKWAPGLPVASRSSSSEYKCAWGLPYVSAKLRDVII